jgi:hypothetical protein
MPNPSQIEHAGAAPSRIIDCITHPPRGFFDRAEAYHACKFQELGRYADIGINLIRPAIRSILPALPRSISAYSGQPTIPLRKW